MLMKDNRFRRSLNQYCTGSEHVDEAWQNVKGAVLAAFSAVCPTSRIRPQDHWMSTRSLSMIDARKSILAGNEYDGADRAAAQIEVNNKLRGSGYPTSLIRRQLRRVLVPVAKPKREWLGTAVIPFKPGTSEIIRRILNTASIRVAFQRGNTLRSTLVQWKDRLPANRTRDCVYKIKCNDCIKVYTSQTARKLHTRIGEHKRKINRPPRNADEYRALLKDLAIVEHALDTGHKIDLENAEVLRRGLRFTSQRLMAEAVEIAKCPSVEGE
ncbi:hypothetical protein CLF_101047 [Clonorchis sinensis]|uniref:C2H2-type domain-containing protein n=1 Tax=Clonorchis sinensis TaxID=79923 RepID=G7Y4U8_CLOSI|nr:hypothetical protein CLF_101047 [Clonorchis sinensis]